MIIPDSARAVLEGPAFAHLVTLEADGSPQVSILWVDLDGDEIVAAHMAERQGHPGRRSPAAPGTRSREYLGPDVKLPPIDDPPPGYITHITVERIRVVGAWAS
jgi:hypothetical protein